MKERTLLLHNGTSLGTWLSQRRKSQGLTTQTLASKIGIDDGNLSRIENDRIQPTLQTVVAICNGLGITWQQLYAALKEPDGHKLLRENPSRYDTRAEEAADTQAVQVADVQNWLALWNRDALHAQRVLSQLYAKVHEDVSSPSSYPITPGAEIQLEAVFRLSPVHHFEITYPPVDISYPLSSKLQSAYEHQELLILEDVKFYIHQQSRLLRSTAKDAAVFLETKLRSGISEKLKFVDAIDLDHALGKNGVLIGMFWLAVQTYTILDQLIAQTVSEYISDMPLSDEHWDFDIWERQMHLLTFSFIRLCRWKQRRVEDDSAWLSQLRQEMAAQAQD